MPNHRFTLYGDTTYIIPRPTPAKTTRLPKETKVYFNPFFITFYLLVVCIMPQLILPEMEDRYPKGTLVTIEEEPRILQRIQIANDMRLPCWRIALGTHDSNLLPLASHIHHNQRMPQPLVTSSRINQHITWLHLTHLSRFRLPAQREGTATAIRLAKEIL